MNCYSGIYLNDNQAKLHNIREHFKYRPESRVTAQTMAKNLNEKVQALLSDIDLTILLDIPSKELIGRVSSLRDQLEFKESCGMGLEPEDYLVFGIDFYFAKKYEPALEKINRALELKPSLLYGLNLKGIILDELNRYDEALEIYEKVLRTCPDSAGTWYNKGITLEELNQPEAAIKTFEKVIEIDTRYTGAWYNIACIYSKGNERTKSLTNLKTAIQYNPFCKQAAKNDEDFKNLWDDEEFIRLTQE